MLIASLGVVQDMLAHCSGGKEQPKRQLIFDISAAFTLCMMRTSKCSMSGKQATEISGYTTA